MSEHEVPEAVARRAEVAAASLVAEGRWTAADDAALDAAFEAAARAALAVPSLTERAPRLRRFARLVVPTSLRPLLGRTARRVDALLRRLSGASTR
jgi:hypothetical protein